METALPDLLNVVDRRVRVRSKAVEPLLKSEDFSYRELAAGARQHHMDDDWFHRTRAFAELSMDFAIRLREAWPAEKGMRAGFLGHVLVEVLLDDCLARQQPDELDRYYTCIGEVDPQLVAGFVHAATGKRAEKLVQFIPEFLRSRFLYDYAEDAKLLYRMNQVMRRVGLAEIPADFTDLVPSLRLAVSKRIWELLTPGEAV